MRRWLLTIFVTLLCLSGVASLANAKGDALLSQLLAYDGKAFTGVQDSEYLSYDQVLREYMVNRISKEFGVKLEPKIYSGFDLLEIQAIFRCKKLNESYDSLLKIFRNQR
jgi:hypothetical protein